MDPLTAEDELRGALGEPVTSTTSAGPGSRYRRPYAVADSLDLLHGPVSGTVHLPVHLDWSGHAEYDLDAPGRIRRDPEVRA